MKFYEIERDEEGKIKTLTINLDYVIIAATIITILAVTIFSH